jgi:hypothetical protein
MVLILFSKKTPILTYIYNAQMLPVRRPPIFTSFRFHSVNAERPPLKLVAGLQKLRGVNHKSVKRASYLEH